MRTQTENRLQKTAIRLIELMGLAEALNCCRENQWVGLEHEIRALRDARRSH